MPPSTILLIAVVAVVAFAAGTFYASKHPADAARLEAQLLQAAMRTPDLFHALLDHIQARNSAPSTAPTTTPAGWTLGDQYTSITALAADIQRPGFTQQITINGLPVYNITGSLPPVNFRTVPNPQGGPDELVRA